MDSLSRQDKCFYIRYRTQLVPQFLLGNRRVGLYFLQGEVMFPGSGGWLSETESKDEADAQMIPLDEESYTSKRLSQYEG